MNHPKIGGTYRHYKNHKLYTIVCIARHTETGESLVVYQGQYDDPEFGSRPIFARPVGMFMDDVEYEGQTVARFEHIT